MAFLPTNRVLDGAVPVRIVDFGSIGTKYTSDKSLDTSAVPVRVVSTSPTSSNNQKTDDAAVPVRVVTGVTPSNSTDPTNDQSAVPVYVVESMDPDHPSSYPSDQKKPSSSVPVRVVK